MTPSSSQPPASPKAEAGPDGEAPATAVTAAAPLPAPGAEPEAATATAGSEPEAGTATRTARKASAAQSDTARSGTPQNGTPRSGTGEPAAGTGPGSGAADDAPSEAGADPAAATAVKSRLPALVRAATSTAIDRPQQRTGPVGRPGRAALAGAAVAGALLVSVPFLVLGGGDPQSGQEPETAGTVLGGSAQEAPGDFALTPPGGSPGDDASGSAKPGKPTQEGFASAENGAGDEDTDRGEGTSPAGAESPPKGKAEQDGAAGTGAQQQSVKKASGGGEDKPSTARSGPTLSAPVSLRSHLSGRCIDVPGADFGDGKKLYVWDCNNSAAQKWQFASDGTMRIGGLCLDVANANYGDGTPVQIARCNGNAAQQFTLNASHDLVNTVVGKCVDIRDNNPGNGAWLQLWSCAGSANQKWSA